LTKVVNMRKHRAAHAVTILLLLLAAALAVARRNGWKPLESKSFDIEGPGAAGAMRTPQDAVYRALDAARAGDIDSYLAAYTGEMAAALTRSLAETNRPAFARYLRESAAAVKGVAVSEPQPLNDREVKLRVEYVYQDRNEGQILYLEKNAGGWRIARMDSAQHVKPLIPYGTPVQ